MARTKIFLGSFGVTSAAALVGWAALRLADEIDQALTLVIWSLAAAVVGALLVGLGLGVYFLATAAERHQQRRQDRLMSGVRFDAYEPGHQVYRTHLTERGPLTAPLHLGAGWSNGQAVEASDTELQAWQIYNTLHSTRQRAALPAPGPEVHPIIEPMPRLLDLLQSEPCVGIVGTRGAGKTSTAMHYLAAHNQAEVTVIDLKGRAVNAWPDHCKVFHTPKDITAAARAARAALDLRRDRGEIDGRPELFFIDESRALVEVLDKDDLAFVVGTVWYLIALGREYNCHAGLTAFGTTVKALGTAGESFMKENLLFVQLDYDRHTNQHSAKVELTGEIIEVEPCPPYRPGPAAPRRLENPLRAQAEQMLAEGISRRQVCLRLLGGDGGEQYAALDKLLAP